MSDEVLDQPDVVALYALDPSEFVAARSAVVAQLKAAGDKDGAKVIGALKKPTRTAWAINQVVRADPARIEELRAAGAELRERQADALSGGDAAALRTATASRRDLVRALAAEVAALAGDSHREEAAATFEAASIDDEVGAIVAAGRLTTAVSRTADLGFLGMPEPTGTSAPRRSPSPKRTRARRTADAPDEEAEEELPEPPRLDRRRIAKLERTLAGAEDAVADAEQAVARTERERAEAEEGLTAAQKRLDAAVGAEDAAGDALHAARRAAEEARAALEALRGT